MSSPHPSARYTARVVETATGRTVLPQLSPTVLPTRHRAASAARIRFQNATGLHPHRFPRLGFRTEVTRLSPR